MINIDELKGFRPRFKRYGEDDVTPGLNGYGCDGITIPTVETSTIACEEFILTDCIKTSKSYNFFGIGTLETLTSALTKIMNKVKAINDKFRTVVDYAALETFDGDVAAGEGGVAQGKPYVDTLGYVRIKL